MSIADPSFPVGHSHRLGRRLGTRARRNRREQPGADRFAGAGQESLHCAFLVDQVRYKRLSVDTQVSKAPIFLQRDLWADPFDRSHDVACRGCISTRRAISGTKM